MSISKNSKFWEKRRTLSVYEEAKRRRSVATNDEEIPEGKSPLKSFFKKLMGWGGGESTSPQKKKKGKYKKR